MLFNVRYVDGGGEVQACSVGAYDVKMAIRQVLFNKPDCTRVLDCVLANLDTVEDSIEQTLG